MKFFSLLYQGEVHTSTDEKIIPAEDFSTLMEAAQILEKAKEDAATYKKEVEKQCEELKENAKREGFSEGLDQWNDHLLYFEKELKKVRHETQNAILPIALKAAKKLVGKELELHPETIVDIVIQALLPVTQSRRIIIYVNKADKEFLEASKHKIRSILEHVEILSIQERADVTPGGCIIEAESGIINASVENQWRALEAAFEKYMAR